MNRYTLITNLAFLITFIPACGKYAPEVKVNTKSEVNAKAEVSGTVNTNSTFTFKIDVSACDKLEGANQATCIADAVKAIGDLVAVIKQLACKDDTCKLPTSIPVGDNK